MTKEFEPKILGFCCNWCSYAGADLAGVSRIQYPPNLRIVRVMCSGRVDPVIVLEVFKSGVDGVLVLGCHPGDCHYLEGNYQTERKIKALKEILEIVGIDKYRLCLDWVSASEGKRFARIVSEFTERIKEIGPLEEKEGLNKEDLNERLNLAKDIAESIRVRQIIDKEYELTQKRNVYGDKIKEEKYDALRNEVISDQYIKSRILSIIERNPLTIPEISKRIDLDPTATFVHITEIKKNGLASILDFKGRFPRYIKAEGGS